MFREQRTHTIADSTIPSYTRVLFVAPQETTQNAGYAYNSKRPPWPELQSCNDREHDAGHHWSSRISGNFMPGVLTCEAETLTVPQNLVLPLVVNEFTEICFPFLFVAVFALCWFFMLTGVDVSVFSRYLPFSINIMLIIMFTMCVRQGQNETYVKQCISEWILR